MKKRLIFTLCGIGAVSLATVAIATPLALTKANDSSNQTFAFHTNLNETTNIKNGQNYVELSVEAKHKNQQELNYQWFYKPNNTFDKNKTKSLDEHEELTSDYKVYDLNETGKQPTLKIIDDLEKYNGYSFICLSYDNNGNYLTFFPHKCIQKPNEFLRSLGFKLL